MAVYRQNLKQLLWERICFVDCLTWLKDLYWNAATIPSYHKCIVLVCILDSKKSLHTKYIHWYKPHYTHLTPSSHWYKPHYIHILITPGSHYYAGASFSIIVTVGKITPLCVYLVPRNHSRYKNIYTDINHIRYTSYTWFTYYYVGASFSIIVTVEKKITPWPVLQVVAAFVSVEPTISNFLSH